MSPIVRYFNKLANFEFNICTKQIFYKTNNKAIEDMVIYLISFQQHHDFNWFFSMELYMLIENIVEVKKMLRAVYFQFLK